MLWCARTAENWRGENKTAGKGMRLSLSLPPDLEKRGRERRVQSSIFTLTATTRRAGAGAEEAARREHEGIAATRPRAMAERILFRRVRTPRGGGRGGDGALKRREQRVKEERERESKETRASKKKAKKNEKKNARSSTTLARLTVLSFFFPSPSRTRSSGEATAATKTAR